MCVLGFSLWASGVLNGYYFGFLLAVRSYNTLMMAQYLAYVLLSRCAPDWESICDNILPTYVND